MIKYDSRHNELVVRPYKLLLACCAISLLPLLNSSSQAQLPTSDQLNQLQQYQQRQNQNQGALGTMADQNGPQSIVLQPAVPLVRQAPLEQSRLEQILSSRAGARLQQFGYDQFGQGRAVTVPMTGAVQDDYLLGSGDEIVVSMRGQENGEFRAMVDRNGQVVIPRLAPLPATGRSLGSFRADLEGAVHRSFVATNVSVSVGRVRQISVLVSGEVNQPGQRLLTGLSSTVDALLLSGGVRKTGSLRNIRITRGGHVYVVDLYSVLTNSGSSSSLRLADGDQILVPPLSSAVAVAGMVRLPGIFELAPHASPISARALLALAGGQEVRGSYRLSLLRVQSDGTNQMVGLPSESGEVRDGDILFVQLSTDKTTGVANLSGGTGLAGAYPIIAGSRLSDILKAPGALGVSPYTLLGILIRKDSTTRIPKLLAFTPVAVLSGKEDQYLQSDDVIRVLSTNEQRMLNYIVHTYLINLAAEEMAVRDPLGQSQGRNNNLINQLGVNAGEHADELSNISGVSANTQRLQITALLETPTPGSRLARDRQEELRVLQLQRQQQMISSQENPISPGQANPGQANPGQANPGQANPGQANPGQANPGQANPGQANPGQANLGQENPGPSNAGPSGQMNANSGSLPQNYTEQVVRDDGIPSNLEVQTFGQLARQLDIDPLVLVNFLVDHRVRLDGALRGPGDYFVGSNVSLDALVQAAGGTTDWADESGVELISTGVSTQTGNSISRLASLPLHQGALASYVVRPGDIFRFRQVYSDVGAGSVVLQGEVRYPGRYPLLRGQHLSDVLVRAGGLTTVAYPYGTVYLRTSAARLERDGFIRAADEVQNQLVIAMTRIGNSKIDPSTFTAMQSFVTELRNHVATGRISVVADPSALAANPSLDPLIEPGDVIFVPQRPSTVSVLGQVLQPGSYPYRAGETVAEYIDRAGGYSSLADEGRAFIVKPDGSAQKIERSWLSFRADKLTPGSAIVVPRDVTPLDLRQTIIDVAQIFSQLAVSMASVAVLSK